MKPIVLTMYAFGPYKQKQMIDFRELQGNRLFAISGKTGAGKTTIFDAIAFALYGSGSGSDRENTKSLRSQFADEKLHTAVDFVFEAKGQMYRIFRQLPHKKKNNKSETGDKIELYEVDSNGVETLACKPKLTDVRAKMEEIIGLTYDQFNQIVMLPQGEFRKLLTSETDNKQKILRKVFKTERYDQIAKKLEAKKKQAEEEANLARKMRDQHIEQIAGAIPERESLLFTRLSEHSNIYQILQALAEEQAYYEQKVITDEAAYQHQAKLQQQKYEELVQAKQQNEQLEQLATKREQFAALQQQKPAMIAVKEELDVAQQAASLKPTYDLLQTMVAERQQIEAQLLTAQQQQKASAERLQQAKTQFELEQQREPLRITLMNELHELEQVQPLYEEVEALKRQLPQLQKRVTSAANELQGASEQALAFKEQAATADQQVEQLQQHVATLPQLLQQQQQLKETLQLLTNYENSASKLQAAAQKVEGSHSNLETAQQQFEAEQQKWIHHRAYELASTLRPGDACPVCGSTEHPSLQQHTEQASPALLKQAQQQLEQAQNERATAIAEYDLLATEQQARLSELEAQQIHLSASETYKAQYEQVSQSIFLLNKQSQQLTALQQKTRELRMKTEQMEQQIEPLRQAHLQAQQIVLQHEATLTSKQQALKVELPTLNDVLQAISQKQQQLTQLKQAFEQAERHLQQCQLDEVRFTQTIDHLQQQVTQLATKQQQQQQAFETEQQARGFRDVQHFLQSLRTEFVMQQMQQQLEAFKQQFTTLKQMIAEQEQRLAGKAQIELETLQQQLEQLRLQTEEALGQLNATKNYATSCQQYTTRLQGAAADIDRLEKVSGEIVQLYKVLVGQNDEFISFERFIQIGYLEEITQAANMRLQSLSNGQFALHCSDRKEGHRRQSGLSLDVYDSYTGLPRDVKTLSGGEKFNASLCLALGLADVIQSYEGNVRIDTMFIDEGFGSLDDESLMRAIDVLIELQKSGRIVGVISHVEELKEAMPAIIQIEKLKTGYSEAKIIVK